MVTFQLLNHFTIYCNNMESTEKEGYKETHFGLVADDLEAAPAS